MEKNNKLIESKRNSLSLFCKHFFDPISIMGYTREVENGVYIILDGEYKAFIFDKKSNFLIIQNKGKTLELAGQEYFGILPNWEEFIKEIDLKKDIEVASDFYNSLINEEV